MLMDAGIDDYRFDSECLLIKAAGKTRRDVLCHGDDKSTTYFVNEVYIL